MLMEIIKDPALLEAVRDELRSVVSKDPTTGQLGQLDSQKLVALPLLQSIWTETLRLRINFNIVRDVKEPVTLGGTTIPKDSLLQVPMMVAHYDEATWGASGHAASEFWAERHIKYTEKVDEHGQNATRAQVCHGRPAGLPLSIRWRCEHLSWASARQI